MQHITLRRLKKHSYLFLMAFVTIVMISMSLLLQPVLTAHAQAIPSDQQVFVAGDTACASPPTNFNPLTASKHDLLYYGLPLKPTGDTKRLDHWLTVVKSAK